MLELYSFQLCISIILSLCYFIVCIYVWLTYRMSCLRRPCMIPWVALRGQFGVDYARVRDFRRRFVAQLAAVLRIG